MVDFRKVTGENVDKKIINPIDLYDSLDRKTTKGELRPAQRKILKKWFQESKNKKDVIIKLHTGQGKTLIGLMILQSKLNENPGKALYLCPDKYLVEQTCIEAENFGIKYSKIDTNGNIPNDFSFGKSILITTVQKLFNGLSKFHIGHKSTPVDYIVMDDAHLSIDIIKNAFKIEIPYKDDKYEKIYQKFIDIFMEDLKKQGLGTFEDIMNNNPNSFLPVPYWAWRDKIGQVIKVLSRNSEKENILFAWPLIKDSLDKCQCIIGNKSIEIFPYNIPIHHFKSFTDASHRIFMSATIHNDSFFVKSLGLDKETVLNPLSLSKEKWSGEKMVLIPNLIDPELIRDKIIPSFAKTEAGINVVVLTPSYNKSNDWGKNGGIITNKNNIIKNIKLFKNKRYKNALVIANRYDGIDLPDDTCRLLIIDSKPFSESLENLYQEKILSNSEIINIKTAQKIEQGLGRSVRGKKDYSAIMILGLKLINHIKNPKTLKYFSNQTRKQIEIGEKIVSLAQEDLNSNDESISIIHDLFNKLIYRDEGWKNYYQQEMDGIKHIEINSKLIDRLEYENKASNYFELGEYVSAKDTIQDLIDECQNLTTDEVGYYLQLMATYCYAISKQDSTEYQNAAYKKNRALLIPKTGSEISRLDQINVTRIENIKNYVENFESNEHLRISISAVLESLSFGVDHNDFENSLENLGKALGFISDRPERDSKDGPDNLWKINSNNYIVFECKNEVLTTRKTIYKSESGQINDANIWFEQNYKTNNYKSILIIPTIKLHHNAVLDEKSEIMNVEKLDAFKNNIKSFFNEFLTLDLNDINATSIKHFLKVHNLTENNILNDYSVSAVN